MGHCCVITLRMVKFSQVGDVNICILAYVQLVPPWQKVFTTKTEEEKAEWMEQTLATVDVLEGGLKECSKVGASSLTSCWVGPCRGSMGRRRSAVRGSSISTSKGAVGSLASRFFLVPPPMIYFGTSSHL